MNIKLSQHTSRKVEHTITEVSTLTRKITLEDLLEIYLNSDAIHVMKKDTLPKIVLETKVSLKRRRNHDHAAEDDEPSNKRFKQESEDSSSDEEYVLIYALMRTITHGSNDWPIDSGASDPMMGFK